MFKEEKKPAYPFKSDSIQKALGKDSYFAKNHPNETCLTYLDKNNSLQSMSWVTFALRVNNVAVYLQNILKEGVMIVLLKRSCSMQVAQAACHLAGRTFVPVDPTWPIDRIKKIVNKTEAVGMIVDEGSSFHQQIPSCVPVNMDMNGICTSDTSDCTATVTPVQAPEVMYMMFTSGSTGEPKGCQVYTDGLWNFLQWKADCMNLQNTDVTLMKTPCTFDVSIGEMWLPLVSGTVSHILGDGLHLEVDQVCEALEVGQVTICNFVPSVLTLFLSQLEGTTLKHPLSKLRLIGCTGEALKKEHRTQLSKVIRPDVELLNLYGPTEATVEVTYFYCEEKEEHYLSHGFPIGHVPKGVDVYVTDPQDPTKLVPDGEKGEICLGGIQLAKGYLNEPQKTAAMFIPCPWSTSKDKKLNMMYRTGDLGRRNPQTGWYEYNGRFDRQVKVGGVRIELGEIESVIMNQFEDTLEAAIVMFYKEDQQLIGVKVPKEGIDTDQIPTDKQLRDGILKELPKAYNPSEWHVVQKEHLPLSTAGKIDYKELRKAIANEQSVQVWAEVYDQLYDDTQCTTEAGADPTMDWASYKDSFYPSRLHRRDVVTEWVNETVEIAMRCAKESAGAEEKASICEMGCGKGMISLNMAPRVKTTVCGDISNFAVNHVQKVWDGHMTENNLRGHNQQFHAVNCDAAAFEKLPSAIKNYNVVICNGVSMYLPSFTYLLSYFDKAIDRIYDNGGSVILGDVRSLHHSPLFHLRRLMQVGRSADEARAEALEFARNDKDRVYDYRAFYALLQLGFISGRVEAFEVQIKMGALASEFTGYRFDVICYVGENSDEGEEKKNSETEREDCAVNIVGDLANVEYKSVTAGSVVSLLKNALDQVPQEESKESVYGVINIPNERLWSDHLIASSQDNEIGFATDGVGVKPSDLRSQVGEAFPNKHIVLTFSNQTSDSTDITDSTLAAMDVFILPKLHSAKVAGLRGIANYNLGQHQESFCSKLQRRSDFECCISELQSQRTTDKPQTQNLQAASESAKDLVDKGEIDAAIKTLIACSLGHNCEVFKEMYQKAESDVTYEEMGGNSFMAMKLIQQMRTSLGGAPAVFKLLTEPLTSFIDDARNIVERQRQSTMGEWMVEGKLNGSKKELSEDAPSIVLFPTAGGSPKVYAKTYQHLKAIVGEQIDTGVKVFLAQPPGRDARANEKNITDFDELVNSYTDAIAQSLGMSATDTGKKLPEKVIICGDSLGSITCWAVVHKLCAMFPGFKPMHVVVSGNPSPEVSSGHWGLGTVAKKSIHDETDEDLLQFLAHGHAGFDNDGDVQEVLDALRSDCTMYEDFKRDPNLKALPVPATFCQGSEDPFVTREDMESWKSEFSGESKHVTLEGAGHHIYAEAGQEMAELLVNIIKENN